MILLSILSASRQVGAYQSYMGRPGQLKVLGTVLGVIGLVVFRAAGAVPRSLPLQVFGHHRPPGNGPRSKMSARYLPPSLAASETTETPETSSVETAPAVSLVSQFGGDGSKSAFTAAELVVSYSREVSQANRSGCIAVAWMTTSPLSALRKRKQFRAAEDHLPDVRAEAVSQECERRHINGRADLPKNLARNN
jgi:hypothetical protein